MEGQGWRATRRDGFCWEVEQQQRLRHESRRADEHAAQVRRQWQVEMELRRRMQEEQRGSLALVGGRRDKSPVCCQLVPMDGRRPRTWLRTRSSSQAWTQITHGDMLVAKKAVAVVAMPLAQPVLSLSRAWYQRSAGCNCSQFWCTCTASAAHSKRVHPHQRWEREVLAPGFADDRLKAQGPRASVQRDDGHAGYGYGAGI